MGLDLPVASFSALVALVVVGGADSSVCRVAAGSFRNYRRESKVSIILFKQGVLQSYVIFMGKEPQE